MLNFRRYVSGQSLSLFGIFSAVDNPARQAFTQEVVGRDLVRNAVTLYST